MTSIHQIEKFLADRKVAVVGASANKDKLGNSVIKELSNKGYTVYPVNPKGGEILGHKVYTSIAELPDDVNSIYILLNKSKVQELVNTCIKYNKRNIWVFQKMQIELAEPSLFNLICGHCIIMYINPSGMHNVHKFFLKLFNKYPK